MRAPCIISQLVDGGGMVGQRAGNNKTISERRTITLGGGRLWAGGWCACHCLASAWAGIVGKLKTGSKNRLNQCCWYSCYCSIMQYRATSTSTQITHTQSAVRMMITIRCLLQFQCALALWSQWLLLYYFKYYSSYIYINITGCSSSIQYIRYYSSHHYYAYCNYNK